MPTLDDFRAFLVEKLEAFHRRDWDAVLDGLPESFEWHFPAEVVDRQGPVRPRELGESLEDLVAQLPDMKLDVVEIVEPAPDCFVARLLVHGAGAASGASIRLDLAQVWEFEDDKPTRVREFTDLSEALAKARQ